MRGESLVVDAVAAGLRASIAHYAHDLAVEVAHRYGQVQVRRASTQAPLPAAYVKVYARQRGGEVAFYKDGYTDLRGASTTPRSRPTISIGWSASRCWCPRAPQERR